MSDNNWNPDDIFDFKYDNEVPKKDTTKNKDFDIFDEFDRMESSANASSQKTEKTGRGLDSSFDSYDEMKRYEKMRNQAESSASSFSMPKEPSVRSESYRDIEIEKPLSQYSKDDWQRPRSDRYRATSDDSIFDEYDKVRASRGRVEEVPEDHPELKEIAGRSAQEIAAIKKASQDAYDRYKSNYTKNKKKRAPKVPLKKPEKWLLRLYALALALFAGSMTIMNILPMGILITFFAVLALLTIVVLVKMRNRSGKKWNKRFAVVLTILLIGIYGLGTSYALGTLSFLSKTSVDNKKSVAIITRDPFNVVVTGIDVRGTIDKQGRSDVNMLLTVNPKTAQVLMTSIPRDYEVYMPDHDNAMDKLTHTGFYSVETTTGAIEQLFDVTANYYVKVNFTTVEKFIDAIGGIEVYSEYEFNPVKMKDWTVKEGMNKMNGEQALAFARERKAFTTGDNQRIKNQQAVFEAMFKKATSSRTMVFSYNRILSNLRDYVEMSMSSKETRALAKLQLAKNPDWRIYKNTVIGGDASMDTFTGGYAYVMSQDEESINNAKTLINAVMEGKQLVKDKEGKVFVKQTSEEE